MAMLLRVHMDDNKLWVFGDCSANEHEMYLPDCTEEQIEQFLMKHVKYMVQVLHKERPWVQNDEKAMKRLEKSIRLV